MNLKVKAVRGSALLSVGEGVNYGASLIRNMILARLLTKADFGIAATFAVVMALLEVSAKLGVSRFVVREKEADRPEFIATAHMVQCCAAIISAMLIAAGAWPIATLFGLKEHVTAFLWLALIPLALGLSHLDVRRFERELRFGPSILVDLVPQVTITILAYPLALWLKDYRVILVLLIVKSLVAAVMSQLLAERPYRWQMHREYTSRMLRFGWPLLVNGFLTFFVVRGDQFIVASFYAMSDLGAYAAAAALTVVPTLVYTRIFGAVMLPIMAKVQDDNARFERRYRLAIANISAFSAAYGVGIVLGAEVFMRLLFGQKYAGEGIILACLATANAFRNLRLAASIAALAKGDSVNQMVSNFWGGMSLLPALTIALAGQPVWMVACSGLFGEALAIMVSILRLKRRDRLPIKASLIPASLVLIMLGLAWAICLLFRIHGAPPILSLPVALAAGLLSGTLILVTMSDSRREASNLFQHIRESGWRSGLAELKGAPGKSVE